MESVCIEDIKAMLMAGKSYRQISEELKQLNPQGRGFSERSVRRYVTENSLRQMCQEEKKLLIETSIREVRVHMCKLN